MTRKEKRREEGNFRMAQSEELMIRVFLGQVPHFWSETNVWHVLSMVFGPHCSRMVKSVHVLRTMVGQHRGCAMVTFVHVDPALVFIERTNGLVPMSGYRPLRVRLAHGDILRFGHGVLVRGMRQDPTWLWNYMSQYGRLLGMTDIHEQDRGVWRHGCVSSVIAYFTQWTHAQRAVSTNPWTCSLVSYPAPIENKWRLLRQDYPTPLPLTADPRKEEMQTVRVGRHTQTSF